MNSKGEKVESGQEDLLGTIKGVMMIIAIWKQTNIRLEAESDS